MIALGLVAFLAAGPGLSGAALVERFQCGRCHESGPILVEPDDRHCVACHRRVGPEPDYMGELGGFGLLGDLPFGSRRRRPARLEGTVTHLRDLPSLEVTGRLRQSWIASFLMRPHDLRRGLGETMPRLPLNADEAMAIAKHITSDVDAPDTPANTNGDVARGLEVLETKGCGMCHAFTGSPRVLVARSLSIPVEGMALVRGMSLAPDLRFTRERTTRAAVRKFLEPIDPEKLGDVGERYRVMPRIPLTTPQIDDVIAALFDAPLAKPRVIEAPVRLPPLDRRVAFAEVKERVLGKTCIHCHADDSLSLGVGGPGNNGGFGFRGTGLVLTGYARVLAGSARPADGERTRKSVFRPVESGPLQGMPLLVAQLRARQVEEAGGLVDGVLGMPLGLPAISAEELQLVETWVAQGRPQ